MSEMKPVGYISETAMKQILSGGYEGVSLRAQKGSDAFQSAWGNDIPLYTADQLAKAVAERDTLIRDLRKELNERRYGRSAEK